MKLSELKPISEDSIPAVMGSGINPIQTADDQDDKSEGYDLKNNEREKILKTGRGENYKKAKAIASVGRTKARTSNIDKKPSPDEEVIQGADDTPHTSGGNYPSNDMRHGQ